MAGRPEFGTPDAGPRAARRSHHHAATPLHSGGRHCKFVYDVLTARSEALLFCAQDQGACACADVAQSQKHGNLWPRAQHLLPHIKTTTDAPALLLLSLFWQAISCFDKQSTRPAHDMATGVHLHLQYRAILWAAL